MKQDSSCVFLMPAILRRRRVLDQLESQIDRRRTSMSCKEIQGQGNDESNANNPPDCLKSSRFCLGSEFLLNEVIVVEVVLRQVHTIVGIGIFSPARLMIGTALRTCQRIARNVFSADWTYLWCPGSDAFPVDHGPISVCPLNNALGQV